MRRTLECTRQFWHIPCLQVSCVHQGQQSCFIEHSRLIILRNDTGCPEDKDFPRVSLYYEYNGGLDITRVPALSLAADGPGRRTGTVLPMAAIEVCHRLCDRDWHCVLMMTCAILPPCKAPLHTDLLGSYAWQTADPDGAHALCWQRRQSRYKAASFTETCIACWD